MTSVHFPEYQASLTANNICLWANNILHARFEDGKTFLYDFICFLFIYLLALLLPLFSDIFASKAECWVNVLVVFFFWQRIKLRNTQHTSDQAIIPASNEKISIRTRTGQVPSRDFTTCQDCSLLVLLTTTKAIPVWGNMGTKFLWPAMLKSASRLIMTGRWKSDSAAELLYTRLLLSRQHSVNIVSRKAINIRQNRALKEYYIFFLHYIFILFLFWNENYNMARGELG